jgi:hypothetical protein
MGLSEQRDQEGGQQAAEDLEEAGERVSGTPSKRSRRGVAKQQRIKELQARIARQAWRQEQAEAQAGSKQWLHWTLTNTGPVAPSKRLTTV